MDPLKTIIDLIKKNGLDLQSVPYASADPATKNAVIKFLNDKNFPSDNPVDLLGDSYVLCWISQKQQLLVFCLSYQEEAVCGGYIMFNYDGATCTYAADTVQCQ